MSTITKLEKITFVNEFIRNRVCPHGCGIELDVYDNKETFLDDLSHHIVFCSKRYDNLRITSLTDGDGK